jgi:hypothetical protein
MEMLEVSVIFSKGKQGYTVRKRKQLDTVYIDKGRHEIHGRSQSPRSLRRRSAAAWFLGSRVLIPLGAWTFVYCVVLCR